MQRALAVTLLLVGCAKQAPKDAPSAATQPLTDACGPIPELKPGLTCTQKSCESGFKAVFQPKAPWPQGSYRFQFDIDGHLVTCTGRIPLLSCAHRNAMCDGADVVLDESGCDQPAPSHTFWSATFQGSPRSIKASAFLDGKPIGKAELKPTYQRSQPNGPGCGPVCCADVGEFQLTF